MPDEKNDARTRIIEAAAEIIGKERNLNLTVREIAGRAGVNIASINYYFRSKDNLMEEVELLMMEQIKNIYAILSDDLLPARERLVQWASRLMIYLIENPGILYMIGTRVLHQESVGFNEYLGLLELGLTPVVRELSGLENPQLLGCRVIQLISGVVYPVLIYSTANKTAGMNIADGESRRQYINSLVEAAACT